ncbi:class I glutamine amidotransferase-like protein [Aulographum hederae CBS 113979]|uniref:Class I glutamine amidotransferase-like protein n=1 Tax=Aulographum hederae CBS 113979 TaxID=1176131 RepID=A0A6G1HHD1_9PEZI|nr:class I glutamine amidotransferase-like protein [Aulographum hederae CBS 113979]
MPSNHTAFSIGYLIFHGFTSLDVWGPLAALNSLTMNETASLSLISQTMDPVWVDRSPIPLREGIASPEFYETVNPTHTFSTAPDLDIIIVPGGGATRNLNATQPYVDFLSSRWTDDLTFMMSVCTGASLLARTGKMDGRNATSNKAAFKWVMSTGPNVNWVKKARWVVDGNLWTSSGVSAGTDMMIGWIESEYGTDKATNLANLMEWNRMGQDNDPFAELYGLTDD